MRALILVMDSVGIGAALDAIRYGNEGADTVGYIAEYCIAGKADSPQREGPLQLPNLVALGLGGACRLATGRLPPGLDGAGERSRHGCASEISKGKDTPSGHWEIAGVPMPFDWGYFPKTMLPSRSRDQAVRPGWIARHPRKLSRLGNRDHRRIRRAPHAKRRADLLHLGRQPVPDRRP